MYITKEKFEEICKKHNTLLIVNGDVSDALEFVQELLEAEVEALKVQEPYATQTIDRLNTAAYEVFNIQSDIENEEFLEQEEVVLPKFVSISVSDLQLDDVTFSRGNDGSLSFDREAVASVVGDYLSDTYGYCHFGFQFKPAFDEYGKFVEVVVTDIQWDIDKAEDLRVVQTLKDLEDYLDDKGWSVYKDEEGWDIRQYSPAGEDFGFYIRHGNDVEHAVEEIKRYASDFDIDEHVELNLGGRGAPGVVELVEDAKEIQAMLDELADGVNWCEESTIGEICGLSSLDEVIKSAAAQVVERDCGKVSVERDK